MLLMLRLLATIVIASSFLKAEGTEDKIKEFIESIYDDNPKIKSLIVKVLDKASVKDHKEWTAYVVEMDAVLSKDSRQVVQKMIWFSNGDMITKELFDLKSSKNLNEFIVTEFKEDYYRKENLIYGNKNSKHKVAIFSDPLCPFCREFVPKAIEHMKAKPDTYAIYYYHFPLENLHPASVELVKAAIALEQKGAKDVILNLYKVKIDPKEKFNEKILSEFNKVMNSNITMVDMLSPDVSSQLLSDIDIAEKLLVNGTPTMFFDGEIDKTKNRYKEAK